MSDHGENITGKNIGEEILNKEIIMGEITAEETDRDLISIIVPCYNEEKALPAFYRAAADAVKDIRGADMGAGTIPLRSWNISPL